MYRQQQRFCIQTVGKSGVPGGQHWLNICLQVSTLQQRVVALQQSHEVQDKELARLRAETLALAARTAAASTGSPGIGSAQRSSSSTGSRGGTGDQQAHQLQQQVAQLQEANTWLQQQLGGWHALQACCRHTCVAVLQLLTAIQLAMLAGMHTGSTSRFCSAVGAISWITVSCSTEPLLSAAVAAAGCAADEYHRQLQALEGDKGHLLEMLAGSEAAARAAGAAAAAAATLSSGSSGSSLAAAAGVASSSHRRRSDQQEQQGLSAAAAAGSSRRSSAAAGGGSRLSRGISSSSSSLSDEQLRSQLQVRLTPRQSRGCMFIHCLRMHGEWFCINQQ
jgi:hypothetical protein